MVAKSIKNPHLAQIPAQAKNNPYKEIIRQYPDIIWSGEPDQVEGVREFLDDPSPLVVDLGCGAGNFLRDYARAFPHYRFAGFELRYKRLVLGALKCRKHGVKQVRLIHERAEGVEKWFTPGSLRGLHINFPDPWAKKKQKKHRLLVPDFFPVIARLLDPEGYFAFKTDHQEYFETVLGQLKEQNLLVIKEVSFDLHHSEYQEENIMTEFESLFINKGFPVYYLKCKVET